MRVALGAHDFGADHTVAAIDFFGDAALGEGFGKAGPAASGVEFGIGFEERLAAACASIDAGSGGGLVLAAEWRLGGFLARNRELNRGKLFSPFVFGLVYFLSHDE